MEEEANYLLCTTSKEWRAVLIKVITYGQKYFGLEISSSILVTCSYQSLCLHTWTFNIYFFFGEIASKC